MWKWKSLKSSSATTAHMRLQNQMQMGKRTADRQTGTGHAVNCEGSVGWF